MSSTQVELSEMEATRGEKFLAFVLAVFLLIGGLWIYFQPLDRNDNFSESGQGYDVEPGAGSPADRQLVDRDDALRRRVRSLRRRESRAQDRLELRREAYRTALEAGRPAAGLEQSYRAAQERLDQAHARTQSAVQEERALRPRAQAAEERLRKAEDKSADAAAAEQRKRDRETFIGRLIYVLLVMAGAFWFFNRLRRRASRYQALGVAAVGFATAQAFVMAGDYTTDYIDVTDSGPLILSLVGIALSVAAFIGLQRYLARRLPRRRVRRGECPFCGFPARGEHCEGCGREIVAACSTCDEPRRVGTPHCAACGNA